MAFDQACCRWPAASPNERLTSREIAALVRELRETLLAPPAAVLVERHRAGVRASAFLAPLAQHDDELTVTLL